MPTAKVQSLYGCPARERMQAERIAADLKAQELSLAEEERQLLDLQERRDARCGRVKGLQTALNTCLVGLFDVDSTVEIRGELYRTDGDIPGLARFIGASLPQDECDDDEPSPSEVAEWAADFNAAVATQA